MFSLRIFISHFYRRQSIILVDAEALSLIDDIFRHADARAIITPRLPAEAIGSCKAFSAIFDSHRRFLKRLSATICS